MEDEARMIAAARRKARRTARKTELTYQQALDAVARDLGREHWAAFTASPVEVPRDTPAAMSGRTEPVTNGLDMIVGIALASRAEIVIDGPDERFAASAEEYAGVISSIRHRARMASSVAGVEVGAWDQDLSGVRVHVSATIHDGRLAVMATRSYAYNVLSDEMLPADAAERRRYLEDVADVLVGDQPRAQWFDERGRAALAAFLEIETLRAAGEGRAASVDAMIRWIRAGFRQAAEDHDGSAVGMPRWLERIAGEARGSGMIRTADTILDISTLPMREMSGVLGTMDRALLPFAAGMATV
jgi:hypothetical protein